MNLSIINAEYLGNYSIRLKFSDGEIRAVDFSQFLLNAKNPMTKKYLDEELFKSFVVKYGDLIWNDYELCFPIYDLYNCKL
jgi:DUF971 family protein